MQDTEGGCFYSGETRVIWKSDFGETMEREGKEEEEIA
jgi:hypothetical protein